MTRDELLESMADRLCIVSHPLNHGPVCDRCRLAAAALLPIVDSWTDGNTIRRTLLPGVAARLCDALPAGQVSELDTTTVGGDR